MSGAKSSWGKSPAPASVKRDASHLSTDNCPKLSSNPTVFIEELDVKLIELGPVETGKQGDNFKFRKIKYNGGYLDVSLAVLPNWQRAPFAAGTAKTADHQELGTAWGMSVDMSVKGYEKMVELEEHLIKSCTELRNDLFPLDAKKKKGGMTEESFMDKWNSKLTPANPDKKYAPTMRIYVEHDETRRLPKIQKMHLREGSKVTRPVPGTINDLVAKSAIVPVVSLSRVYAGQTGMGCKWELRSCDILTNMRGSNEPTVDYSNVQILDEETPDDSANVKAENQDTLPENGEGAQFKDLGVPSGMDGPVFADTPQRN